MSGYWLRHYFIDDASFWKNCDRLVYFVLLPLMLIHTLSGFSFDPSMVKDGLIVFCLVSVMACAAFMIRRIFSIDGPEFTSVFQGLVRANFYISLSAAFLLYGKEGVAYLSFLLIFLVLSATVYSILVLDRYGHAKSKRGMREGFLRLARNPIIFSTVAGIVLASVLGPLPDVVSKTMDIFGRATLPLALLGIGASLEFRQIRRSLPVLCVTAALRLVVAPALCILVALYFGLDQRAMTCCALLFAVPSAASSLTFASQMGGDVRLMSLILAVQTVLSFVTLSLVLSVIQYLF